MHEIYPQFYAASWYLDELFSWISDDALGMTNEEYADEEGKKTELEHSNEPGFAFNMSNGNVRSSALKVDNPALESTISRSV